MHKKLVNELRLTVAIKPEGPLLIKSGREAGANPTLLDMNFVRTTHADLGETVYLPGSSLKGAIRSYCEKIGRTVGLPVCNPLDRKSACGNKLERQAKSTTTAKIYHDLCPICRIFGHTVMASHLQMSDAYPTKETCKAANQTEERNGVAIDRVSGAVAVGPFQLEAVTHGEFVASLTLRNFQLWQVGLLAIALRDMAAQRVPLGFARSRGLGRVGLHFNRLEIEYPGQFGRSHSRSFGQVIYGVTEFLTSDEISDYGLSPELPLKLPAATTPGTEWGRVNLTFTDSALITDVLRATVLPWANYVETKGAS